MLGFLEWLFEVFLILGTLTVSVGYIFYQLGKQSAYDEIEAEELREIEKQKQKEKEKNLFITL